jgi:hypothetical protein
MERRHSRGPLWSAVAISLPLAAVPHYHKQVRSSEFWEWIFATTLAEGWLASVIAVSAAAYVSWMSMRLAFPMLRCRFDDLSPVQRSFLVNQFELGTRQVDVPLALGREHWFKALVDARYLAPRTVATVTWPYDKNATWPYDVTAAAWRELELRSSNRAPR